MRHVGTMMGNNSHQFILIHLHQFCWRDTLRHNDHRLIPKIYPGRDTSQFTDQAVGNLPHIIQPFFNRNVTKAVDGISFDVEKGEYIGIMGASGSGKTTLLNCISTIDRVTSGHIFIDGMDVTKLKGKHLSKFRREQLGFIFQDFNLLDTLTAYENIALALTIMKTPAKEIDDRVKSIAEKLMITKELSKYPYQLSGGQIGRAHV